MKNIALIALLSVAVVGTAQSNAPSLTGKWKVHASIAGNDSDSECTFAQTGADLAGTCGVAEQGTVKITGKVDGKKVTWSYNSEYNGTTLTMKYSGTVAADKITGEVTVDPYAVTGEFTATVSK